MAYLFTANTTHPAVSFRQRIVNIGLIFGLREPAGGGIGVLVGDGRLLRPGRGQSGNVLPLETDQTVRRQPRLSAYR